MEKEILLFLKRIEKGDLIIVPNRTPFDIYSGNVIYKVNNGWEITVYNDANHWDYIDNIRTNDGRFFDFDDLDKILSIRNYCPSKEISSKIYKIENV